MPGIDISLNAKRLESEHMRINVLYISTCLPQNAEIRILATFDRVEFLHRFPI
jgi:hypothetical protein